MLKFLKSIAMLSLFQSVNSNQGFKFIDKFVLDVNDWHVVLDSIKTPLYYNPVDEDWKRDKCSSLGFTYKKTISRQIFTPFMIPVDKFFDVRSMYIVLSEFICGDQTLSQRFMRNILENLKINQEIQSLFETNQLFEQFIKETVLIIDRDNPINEECPICCENADITLWNCNHPICKICFEKSLIKRKKTCPLCRSVYKNITSNEGLLDSVCNYADFIAAAHYLDVCIYVFDPKYSWILYRKGRPNIDLDMKNEKCIYLYFTGNCLGVVTNVLPLP